MGRELVFALLIVAFLPNASYAQCLTEETASVTESERRVIGRDGKPVPGAHVSVKRNDATREPLASMISNREGLYRIKGLKLGTYIVLVSADGYTPYKYVLTIVPKSPHQTSELHLQTGCHDMVTDE